MLKIGEHCRFDHEAPLSQIAASVRSSPNFVIMTSAELSAPSGRHDNRGEVGRGEQDTVC